MPQVQPSISLFLNLSSVLLCQLPHSC
uniref:Uncharacterized protein n=1 Tax=Arundo donax TaxID=35708 RepID=A0A0A8YEP9_ARUDO